HHVRRLNNALPGGLDESVRLDLEAAAASLRVALEFGLDPLPRRDDALAFCRERCIVDRKRMTRAEADQLLDGLLDVLRRDLLECGSDLRIRRHGRWRCGARGSTRSSGRFLDNISHRRRRL